MNRTDSKISKIAMTGLFAAMSYVVFTFLQFKITLPGGDATSIHLGNAVCVLERFCWAAYTAAWAGPSV